MEDLITAHADRVRDANEKHRIAIEAIRANAADAINKEIDRFNAAMKEVARALSDARDSALIGLERIISSTAAEMDGAFTDNILEVSGSEAAMNIEIGARQHFFATGKLPEPPKIPDVASGPVVGEAANDQSVSDGRAAA